jgi:hypothetical protein
MNPLVLVGFDLVVSAVLVLLAMYVVWNRVRSHLESHGNEKFEWAVKAAAHGNGEGMKPAAEASLGEWELGGITQKAASLKQKGCSMEEIAQRLQVPTREVEMVLAISEMAKEEKSGQAVSVPLRFKPEAARPA